MHGERGCGGGSCLLCVPIRNGGFSGVSDGKESACNAGDLGAIPGLGRSPGGGNGNPFHFLFFSFSYSVETSLICSGVRGFLPVISWHSVRTILYVRCTFEAFVVGGERHIPVLHPLDCRPRFLYF